MICEIKSSRLWNQKTKVVLELDDENWLADLEFLVDLTAHLNELNIHLQGKKKKWSIQCFNLKQQSK